MSFISELFLELERPTAGSSDTARKVMELCGTVTPKKAVFIGDECFTPRLIADSVKADVLAAFFDENRAQTAAECGLTARTVGAYEIPRIDGGWDFIWYNGLTEPDGVGGHLERLRDCLKKGGTAVYRTLCWLIDPSPDTRCYVERRFGRPVPLDEVLITARQSGFKIRDFYIAPKTDWTRGLYQPLAELVKRYESSYDDETGAGIGEINKEMYMFELHSEEYSFVYYILEY